VIIVMINNRYLQTTRGIKPMVIIIRIILIQGNSEPIIYKNIHYKFIHVYHLK